MFRLAMCQTKVFKEKRRNIENAEKFIKDAADNGADVVSLSEMWNCPYSNDFFEEYAEEDDGDTVGFLSHSAQTRGIYLIGGSIPERSGDKIYNTSFCFDPEGKMIGRHRKIHLFDINIKDGIRFMESDTLTAGKDLTVIDTEYCSIGVAICYDMRFPELFRKMTLAGARLIILPGAFNMTTGPAHWDLTVRARALDNQIYFAANAPARDERGVYTAFGNSCIADPWGRFIAHGDEKEGIIYGDIDLEYIDKIRNQLPLLKHRRIDIY